MPWQRNVYTCSITSDIVAKKTKKNKPRGKPEVHRYIWNHGSNGYPPNKSINCLRNKNKEEKGFNMSRCLNRIMQYQCSLQVHNGELKTHQHQEL